LADPSTGEPPLDSRRFLFLARHFNYASRLLSIGVKVTVNQIVFTPVFNTYFFGAQAVLSGASAPEAWDRVKKTVPVSTYNSLKLWPAVTAFSFTFIPLEYRSIFAGVIAVGWQTYLNFLNRRAEMGSDSSRPYGDSAIGRIEESNPAAADGRERRTVAA
jgi:protein Mpv17